MTCAFPRAMPRTARYPRRMPRLLEVVLGEFPRRPIHESVQPGPSQLAVLVLHAVWAVAQAGPAS